MMNWLWAIPWAAIILFAVGFAVGNMIGKRTARKEDCAIFQRQANDRDIYNQIDTLRDIVERINKEEKNNG